jgi:hypothetical protein
MACAFSSVADPDPRSGAFLTCGSGMGKKQDPDRDEHPESYFRELGNSFFGQKYFEFFDADPDPGSERNLFDPGSGMEKFGLGIREKTSRIRNTGFQGKNIFKLLIFLCFLSRVHVLHNIYVLLLI